MRISILRQIFCIGIIAFSLTACKKEAGKGGTSTITGRVFVQDYNNLGLLNGEYYGPEERVYITYGDGNAIDDDARTGPNGWYKFEFLHNGTYNIYAYSDCDTCASGLETKRMTVEITDRKTEYTVSDIVVRR